MEGHGPKEPFATVLGIDIPHFVITMWVIMFILVFVSWLGTRKMKRVPSGVQNVVEFAVEGIYNFLAGMMGESRARAYLPLLGSFFFFILLSNYSGLIPGMGMIPGMKVPTSDLSITAALGITTFFVTHISGIQRKGIKYFAHFLTPVAWMLPINLIDELVRPVSLSFRLYGNIFGEETVINKIAEMAPLIAPLPMMALALLTGAIQAFVFTLLSTVYITGATEDHH